MADAIPSRPAEPAGATPPEQAEEPWLPGCLGLLALLAAIAGGGIAIFGPGRLGALVLAIGLAGLVAIVTWLSTAWLGGRLIALVVALVGLGITVALLFVPAAQPYAALIIAAGIATLVGVSVVVAVVTRPARPARPARPPVAADPPAAVTGAVASGHSPASQTRPGARSSSRLDTITGLVVILVIAIGVAVSFLVTWRIGVVVAAAGIAVMIMIAAWTGPGRLAGRLTATAGTVGGLGGVVALAAGLLPAGVTTAGFIGMLVTSAIGLIGFARLASALPPGRRFTPVLLVSYLVTAAGVVLCFALPARLVAALLITAGCAGLIFAGGIVYQASMFRANPYQRRRGVVAGAALLLVVGLTLPAAGLAVVGAGIRSGATYTAHYGTLTTVRLDGCQYRISTSSGASETATCSDANWTDGGQRRTGTLVGLREEIQSGFTSHVDTIEAYVYRNDAVTPAYEAAFGSNSDSPLLQLAHRSRGLMAMLPLALLALLVLVVVHRANGWPYRRPRQLPPAGPAAVPPAQYPQYPYRQ